MRLSLIVAMAENRVIGVDNRLPWHLSADLQNFKKLTMGKPILMGRRTFESIGRPLPGRENVIVTRTPGYNPPGCSVFPSVDAALERLSGYEEVMVIGGAAFYTSLLPSAHRLYLTVIHHEFEGDTFFPNFDLCNWKEVCRREVRDDDSVPFSYTFLTLDKLQSPAI